MKQPVAAEKSVIHLTVPTIRSPRVVQLESIFDLPPSERSETTITVDLLGQLTRPWSIGLIVGPSGSGKSTIARTLFDEHLVKGYDWPTDRSLVDAFPVGMSIKDIVVLLSSVGFSSPPSWLRPFHVLSNGEQFRASVARALAECSSRVVFDEFTSVVDRVVAQIGSSAVARTVRNRNLQFIAVSCHYDIIEWLQPDWVYDTGVQAFQWRCLQRRPDIALQICRVPTSAWRIFAHHHYLTGKLNPTARCFAAFYRGRPVAFDSWVSFVGRLRDSQKAVRAHRTVCLPDYQGVGIGTALYTFDAALHKAIGYRAFSNTAHPVVVAQHARSAVWKLTRPPARTPIGKHSVDRTRASDRLTASAEYVGPPLDKEIARRLLAHEAVWA